MILSFYCTSWHHVKVKPSASFILTCLQLYISFISSLSSHLGKWLTEVYQTRFATTWRPDFADCARN